MKKHVICEWPFFYHFRKQFKLSVGEIGIYMGIVSLMMPLSLFVLVPLFTGKMKIRDRYYETSLET